MQAVAGGVESKISVSPSAQLRPPVAPLVPAGEILHHAADMTVTASADVTLASLQAELAGRGQWLPIDGNPARTLGELVLGNSTGPLRLGYGAWRDVLLGMQFRNAEGELITAGGRVVKNVAGYDLTKFMVGSHGVFGTPVTLTARTWKRPTAAVRVMLSGPPDVSRFAGLLPTPLRPHWAVLNAQELALGYHGDADAAELLARHGTALDPAVVDRTSLEADFACRASAWPHEPAWRASVPPARIRDFAGDAGIDAWSADPAFGIVVARSGAVVDPERLRSAARRLGGSVALFDADARPTDITCDPGAYALLRRLKQAFDPNNRLAPLPPYRDE